MHKTTIRERSAVGVEESVERARLGSLGCGTER
jgi:hypothetical protein